LLILGEHVGAIPVKFWSAEAGFALTLGDMSPQGKAAPWPQHSKFQISKIFVR
jgi:hypothetical protein